MKHRTETDWLGYLNEMTSFLWKLVTPKKTSLNQIGLIATAYENLEAGDELYMELARGEEDVVLCIELVVRVRPRAADGLFYISDVIDRVREITAELRSRLSKGEES